REGFDSPTGYRERLAEMQLVVRIVGLVNRCSGTTAGRGLARRSTRGTGKRCWGRSSAWLEHSTVTREVAGSNPVAPVVVDRGSSEESQVGALVVKLVD